MYSSRIGWVLSAAIFLAILPPHAAAATILMVRHAERNPGMSPDVLLNAAGEQRARDLAEVLRDANVKHIYVTEVRRTMQTAEPLAGQLHLKPEVVPAKEIDALVAKIQALGESDTVLVVGHVNTTPQVVAKLGGAPVPGVGEYEYDRLTVVFTTGSAKPRVLTLRYGKPAH